MLWHMRLCEVVLLHHLTDISLPRLGYVSAIKLTLRSLNVILCYFTKAIRC